MAYFKGDVYSYELGKMTPLEVYLPYDDKKRFLVNKPATTLVLLHGLGGNYSYWGRFTSVERYAQNYNLALVMPDAEMSMYADMKYGQNYEKYIAFELKEIINNLFKMETDREHYYIAGLSMGGYGALKIALKYPDIFGKCGSFSGALMIGTKKNLYELSNWIDPGVSNEYCEEYEIKKALQKGCMAAYGESFTFKEDEDLFCLAKKAKHSKKNLPKILMTCGTEDFVYDINKKYVDYLKELDIDREFHEWPGIHDWKFWDESIRDYINFFVNN
ncbi:MAG: alpha/beta hydrolase family protein [Tissierellia bacterium]|nr:alpha/beta hydrolase family protein [Tissierellia bacterium]